MDIKIAMSGPDADNPNNRRLHVDGVQWAKVYGFTPEQAAARADIICKALAGPLKPAVLALLEDCRRVGVATDPLADQIDQALVDAVLEAMK